MSNNLWQKIENRHNAKKATTPTAQKNNLYAAIIAGDNNRGNNSVWDNSQGISDGINGFGKLAETLGSKSGTGSTGWGSIGTAANSFITGTGGSSGSAITSAINGTGGSGSAITDAITSNVGSSGSGAGGAGGSTPWAAIAGLAKGGYNAISGKEDEDYSDVEESIIYPLQGAAIGGQFGGPWGAAGGALYGLGYSLKDELGLKDSNFLTQMLLPIGMGDGGGLKIGGESVLDLG